MPSAEKKGEEEWVDVLLCVPGSALSPWLCSLVLPCDELAIEARGKNLEFVQGLAQCARGCALWD